MTSGDSAPCLSAWDAASSLRQFGDLSVSERGVFWLTFEPSVGGTVITALDAGGSCRPLDQSLAIRSRVNGYGGGALCAGSDCLYAVSEEQQIVRLDLASHKSQVLAGSGPDCFGGLVADTARQRVLAVRETAAGQQLVAVDNQGCLELLHQGEDFYGAPVLSSDGRQIAWISWQLPDMPWIRSTLWTAALDEQGVLGDARAWSAPIDGSIQQPVFDGDDLWVLSDHDGWWQPFRFVAHHGIGVWLKGEAPDLDHASAPWQLGEHHHCHFPGGGWLRVRYSQGGGELWLRQPGAREPVRLARAYGDFRCLQTYGECIYCIARSANTMDAVLQIHPETGEVNVLAGGEPPWSSRSVVQPLRFEIPSDEAVEFPVSGFFYCQKTPGDAPPALILIAHGGPTSAAYPVFNPQVQFWCQRGFAVAEVNYRGSSGFGRAYRMALAGRWGEADVEDMERAADHLSGHGLASREKVFIQGRSSGGYTALMAMIQSDRFAGGASLFGVTDPLRLRAMTHRFESGYLDWLLGSPAAFPDRWHERTPLNRAAAISAPVIFFQGGRDQVVVPEQTRAMVSAIKAAGGFPQLHWFEEEGHGFRQQANQAGVLEWLFSFYRKHSLKADDHAEHLS
ncbi:peptidase S9 [Marinobacter salinus]|uniref:Peptidase S9 n=1 Tax=Marinobacter salinus TaxID=1874317 RepID=A0A1D9GRV5_9GAMM|nr:peptidase S9 [Marinobacter salinus]